MDDPSMGAVGIIYGYNMIILLVITVSWDITPITVVYCGYMFTSKWNRQVVQDAFIQWGVLKMKRLY